MIRRRPSSYPWPVTLIFGSLAVGLGLWGYFLAQTAFTQPPPASQIYAAVFVRDTTARVTLKATVNPDEPWRDQLTISVTGARASRSGWLLVIECPAQAPRQSRMVHLDSETAPQVQSQTGQAFVYAGVSDRRFTTSFYCFSQAAPPGTPGYPPSLGNVSLPALQTDQEIEVAQAAPALYARQNQPGGPVGQLIQVFPGAACPAAATPVPSGGSGQTPASSSPASSSPASSSTASSSPPSASASASPSSSASPSVSASPLATPACYQLAPAGAPFIAYGLPASVRTAETVSHVDIHGYQINSMFPVATTTNEPEQPGQTAEESITWNGLSGLSPNLDVTNTAAGTAAGHDTFWAGILVGAAAGFAATFLDKVTEAGIELFRKWQQRMLPPEKTDAAGGQGQPKDADQDPANRSEEDQA